MYNVRSAGEGQRRQHPRQGPRRVADAEEVARPTTTTNNNNNNNHNSTIHTTTTTTTTTKHNIHNKDQHIRNKQHAEDTQEVAQPCDGHTEHTSTQTPASYNII